MQVSRNLQNTEYPRKNSSAKFDDLSIKEKQASLNHQ